MDFGIITIREDEYQAVLERFQPDRLAQGNRHYSVGSLTLSSGGHYVFATLSLPEQGQGNA